MTFIEKCKIGRDAYQKQRFEMKNRMFKYQDGNNCKRLYKWIENNATKDKRASDCEG